MDSLLSPLLRLAERIVLPSPVLSLPCSLPPPVLDDHLASIVSRSRRPRLATCISCFRADGSVRGMPSSGWLAALTRHFTRTPSVPRAHAHTRECGRAGECLPNPPSRPTTPWNLESLDDEIQRAAGDDDDLQESKKLLLVPAPPSAHRDSPSAMSAAAGPQRRGSSSRPTSASSRPPSSASRPTSAPSRPTSAASRLSAPARPLLRSQTQAETAAGSGPPTPLPAQVDDPGDYHALLYDLDARGHYFIPPVIPPLYDRAVAAPTPMSTRCNTPVWDLDGEKRVRFLEPEQVVGDTPSRPPSVTSQYSQVLKNSARFLFQPSQALTGDPGGHNPRYCNCPCHFFPSGRKSVGIQVKRTDPEPPRPRHYRLFFTPTMRGLEQVNFGTKSVSLATRAVFSQVRRRRPRHWSLRPKAVLSCYRVIVQL
ncbi:hypothetical protein C7M84_021935 [Penaeus vannamei]|uniref:Uncharacterized protein n=1 Tax=Penaeus vannamei TaxID=6689 RepID=A0A423U840_PENVA|nr:hypothetical protein C7M84_021935 [Penaeus vannamei]